MQTSRVLRVTTLVAALVAALPSLGVAQPGRGAPPPDRPQGGRPPAERPAVGGVTRILNLRRVLDLTPRQVAQLDSIERAVVAERRPALERMRAARAADWERRDGRPLSPDSARARMAQARPQLEQLRRSDSVATAAAERVLTEAQRARWREMRAYARGRADASRAGGEVPGGFRGGVRGGMRGGMRGGRMPLQGLPMRPMAPLAPPRPRPPVE